MYYIYLLLLVNKNIYKGVASNLKRRIAEHIQGEVASTKNYLPLKLIHYEAYISKKDALRREKFLKTNEGRKLLRGQLSSIFKKFGIYNEFVGR